MYLSDSKSIGEKMEQEFSENAKNLTDDERTSAFNTNMVSLRPLSDRTRLDSL
jgi:phytanoyl-CoA hydroxylase